MSESNAREIKDIQRVNRLEEEAKRASGANGGPLSADALEVDYSNSYEETNIEPELRKDIEAVLNVCVRPKLAEDGGDIEVTYLEDDGTLWIQMLGGCHGCPSADQTAKGLVEKELIRRIDAVKSVEIDDGLDYDFIQEALETMLGSKGKSA